MKKILIKVLKGFSGDSIFLQIIDSDVKYNVLIDSGTKETYYDDNLGVYGDFKHLLDDISQNSEKIDLLIITHIDNDHIGGVIRAIENESNFREIIGEVWFNSIFMIKKEILNEEPKVNILQAVSKSGKFTGIKELIDFESFLKDNKIEHYLKFSDQNTINSYGNNLKIEILSPNINILKEFYKKSELRYNSDTQDKYTGGGTNDWNLELETLINSNEQIIKYDKSLNNKTSIAFMLSFYGKNLLFLGDSHHTVIYNDLLKKGYSKSNKLHCNVLKISHHGSIYNTSTKLLDILSIDICIISTDGKNNGHPSKKLIAQIIKRNPNVKFIFNYDDYLPGLFRPHENVRKCESNLIELICE